MDHSYISRHEVIANYVAGRLSSGESARFEEHMIACPECQDEVSLAGELKAGLEEAARSGAWAASPSPLSPQKDWFGWLRFPLAIPAPAWALAGIMIAAVPAWMAWHSRGAEIARLSAQARELRASNDGLQKRLTGEAGVAAAGVPVITLALARGANDANAPAPQVSIAPGQSAIVLAIEMIHDAAVKRYRATILDSSQRAVAVVDSMAPTAADTIGIEVRSGLLTAGRYSAVIDGVTAEGRSATLGRFPFEVVR